MSLKENLKSLKLNESAISMVIGVVVIVVVGILVIRYFRSIDDSATLPPVSTEEEAEEFTIRIDSPPQGISRRSQKTSFANERPTEPSLTSTQWKRFTE